MRPIAVCMRRWEWGERWKGQIKNNLHLSRVADNYFFFPVKTRPPWKKVRVSFFPSFRPCSPWLHFAFVSAEIEGGKEQARNVDKDKDMHACSSFSPLSCLRAFDWNFAFRTFFEKWKFDFGKFRPCHRCQVSRGWNDSFKKRLHILNSHRRFDRWHQQKGVRVFFPSFNCMTGVYKKGLIENCDLYCTKKLEVTVTVLLQKIHKCT